MKFSSLLDADLIQIGISGSGKEEIFRAMIQMIHNKYPEVEVESVLKEIMVREEMGATTIGHHVSVPHARIKSFDDFVIAIATHREGLDWETPDGKPVKILFMILSNQLKNAIMLKSLSAIAQLMSEEKHHQALLRAEKPERIIQIIADSRVEIKKTITASDIMRTEFPFASPEMTLKELVMLFAQKGIDGVAVLNDAGEIIGEITGTDIIKIGLPDYINMLSNVSFLTDFEPFEDYFRKETELRVKDVLKKEPPVVNPETSIIQVAHLMVTKNKRRIYVVQNERLVGVVYREDLMSKVFEL